MPYGLPWSEDFIRQLADDEIRAEFVADHVRTRIAAMIRALREERGWTQAKLGEKAGKPQNVISRLENPDYGKPSLETLLEVAAAYGLPLFVDIPEWEDWFRYTRELPGRRFSRRSFDAEQMIAAARAARTRASAKVVALDEFRGGALGLLGATPQVQRGEMATAAVSPTAPTISGPGTSGETEPERVIPHAALVALSAS